MKRPVKQRTTIQLVVKRLVLSIKCSISDAMWDEFKRYKDQSKESAKKWMNTFRRNVENYIENSRAINESPIKNRHNITSEFMDRGICYNYKNNVYDLEIVIGNEDFSNSWEGIPVTCLRDEYDEWIKSESIVNKEIGNLALPLIYKGIETPAEVMPWRIECQAIDFILADGEVEEFDDDEE